MIKYIQSAASAPLEQITSQELAEAQSTDLRVLASAPTAEEFCTDEAIWPRVPGAVTIAADSEGGLFFLPPFVPCWQCPACDAALHLACRSPHRYGVNRPGGFALGIAPVDGIPAQIPQLDVAEMAGLIAMGGLTYQAQASVGMVPGDVVFVYGDLGPGAVPLQILSAGGMRPYCGTEYEGTLPKGALPLDFSPLESPLPSPRWHILDLSPSANTFDRWRHLVGSCVSCTLVGAVADDLPVSALLSGQAVLRRIQAVHPHLILDLLAHLASERVVIRPWLEVFDAPSLAQGIASFRGAASAKWPVYVAPNE
jgi:hypothetical protein